MAALRSQHHVRYHPVRSLTIDDPWVFVAPHPVQSSIVEESTNIYPRRYSEVRALMNNLKDSGQEDINDDSYKLAFYFLLHLPEEIVLPKLWIDPLGYVAGEWFNRRSTVSLLFKPNREFLIVGYNQFQNEIFEKTTCLKTAASLIKSTLYP